MILLQGDVYSVSFYRDVRLDQEVKFSLVNYILEGVIYEEVLFTICTPSSCTITPSRFDYSEAMDTHEMPNKIKLVWKVNSIINKFDGIKCIRTHKNFSDTFKTKLFKNSREYVYMMCVTCYVL